jgi:hypothetical protein
MKYFFDTEFIEDGRLVHLVSIGMVSDDGRELYLESAEAPLERANDFVKEHVLPYLEPVEGRVTNLAIQRAITEFVTCDEPRFVAWYNAYDWFLMCQLFGGMGNLPSWWPKYCYDLQQLYDHKGGEFPPMPANAHHALADAQWCCAAWRMLDDSVWRPRT